MSTSAAIVVKMDNDYRSIYVSRDGYFSHLGVVLATYYNTRESAERIVSLGDARYIGPSLDPMGESHRVDRSAFYHRDLGEPLETCVRESLSDILSEARSEVSWVYFFDDQWYMVDYQYLVPIQNFRKIHS